VKVGVIDTIWSALSAGAIGLGAGGGVFTLSVSVGGLNRLYVYVAAVSAPEKPKPALGLWPSS
jgi:hypothetical protein